jgi:putative transferase (TIGR04331 family)
MHKTYLISTADSAFFGGKYVNAISLGPWCNCPKEKRVVMKSPYKSNKEIEKSYIYVSMLYEKILKEIVPKLNQAHNKNYQIKEWRIILGPWLFPYISSCYDRYLHVRKAMQNFPNFETIALSEKSFVTPLDTLNFHDLIENDTYNLQIFSQLYKELGLVFLKRNKIIINKMNINFSSLIKNRLAEIFNSLSTIIFKTFSKKNSSGILIKNSYFPKSFDFYILFRNIGKALLLYNTSIKVNFIQTKSFKSLRSNVLEIGKSKFEKILSRMIFRDMPYSFLENFNSLEVMSLEIYPQNLNVIFSANSWYFDEPFKLFCAKKINSSNSLLIGSQHGGNYGSKKYLMNASHELEICDFYYTWGWTQKNFCMKIKPFFINKILNMRKIDVFSHNKKILWAGTSQHRYLFEYPNAPINFIRYLERQERFLKNLSNDCIQYLEYRPHSNDWNWNIFSRLNYIIPNLKKSNPNIKFHTALNDCAIYITDHLSTTFIESLALNKPTILFWEETINEEARPYYQLLLDAKILFKNPEDAAKQVNLIYNDIQSWWLNSERQRAITNFTSYFGKNSDSGENEWLSEFNKLYKHANCNNV